MTNAAFGCTVARVTGFLFRTGGLSTARRVPPYLNHNEGLSVFEVRRAKPSDVSGKYDSTEVLSRKRTVDSAKQAVQALSNGGGGQPGMYRSKELGIFDTEKSRWVRGYLPAVLA